MNKYFYPAVFHPEETGFSVSVPDIDGCFTEGDTLEEAMDMVFDAIGLCLEDCEEFPKASLPNEVPREESDFIVLVPFDKAAYQKKHDTRAVKKTLTIPSWLNTMAEEHHINFSSVLQSALKQQLQIDNRP